MNTIIKVLSHPLYMIAGMGFTAGLAISEAAHGCTNAGWWFAGVSALFCFGLHYDLIVRSTTRKP